MQRAGHQKLNFACAFYSGSSRVSESELFAGSVTSRETESLIMADESTQQMRELEACPFCGSGAFTSWDGDTNSPDDWSANCDNTIDCGACVQGMTSEDAAVTAWNTRTK